MAATGVMIGAGGMAVQGMMAFTRDEERAADDYAVKLLTEAGIPPAALLSVFQKMQNMNDQSRVNPNNITHPLTEERIKNIKSNVGSLKPEVNKKDIGLPTPDFRLIQAKLIGYLDSAERVRTLYPSSDKSDAALYARAIMRMRNGDLETAKTGTLTLISRHKGNPYFYELLGDIEFQYGHYDDSVTAYEKSLKELKQNREQIEIALALVLSERKKPGDSERAANLCKRAILKEPMPLAYWVLAKSDNAKSDYYLSEYYYLAGDIKKARQYAAAAIKKLKDGTPEYLKAKDILNQGTGNK
jgi:predicted Zn-dependent protease